MKIRKNIFSTIVSLLIFIFLNISAIPSIKAVAEPETWTFEAYESTYVSSANLQSNYSAYAFLSVKNQPDNENMALMKFDISSIFNISGHPTVEEASLSLYTLNPAGTCDSAPAQFSVERLSSDWVEDDVNKNTMPLSNVFSTSAALACPGSAQYQSFGAFEVARSLIEERLPNYGIAFAGLPYMTGSWRRSFSSSRGTHKPRLYITFADYVDPSFTSTGASNITKNSAKITWTTDEPSSVKVDWGTSASYGSSQSFPSETHEISLSSLSPATTYHFRLTAYDHFSNDKITGDYTFTTLSDSADSLNGAPSSSSTGTNTLGNNTNSSTKAPAAATNAKDATKEVDAAIAAPNVEYIVIGDKRTEAPFNEEIKIFTNEESVIGGDSFPSAKIVIIIGDQAFITDADSAGIWEIKIAAKDVEIKKYEVMVQAQDAAKDKGSEIIKSFDLLVEKNPDAPLAEIRTKLFNLSILALINIGGAILIVLLGGTLVLLHFKKRKLPLTDKA